MTMTTLLREATANDHAVVDALFGAIDLSDEASYAGFLQSHARALPAAEAYLHRVGDMPTWRPRLKLLETDLAKLGRTLPPALPFEPPLSQGAAWGVLYVLEGSRLGNLVLSRTVPPGWPAAFLHARHEPGEWRALLAALDAEARTRGSAWAAAAISGARACFDLYRRAA